MTDYMPSVISIDPKHAIDLDDAIGIRYDGKDIIADICLPDVPSFVAHGGALDQQAYERGFTLYHANNMRRPMLTSEVTSHLTLSPNSRQMMIWVQLRYSIEMELKNVTIERIRHHTAARLSYAEADQILLAPDHHHYQAINNLTIFAKALHSRRQKRTGALFDISTGLYTSEDGCVNKLADQDRYLSHMVVMEFMIATNSGLAALAHKKGTAILYRNHKPDEVANGDRSSIRTELLQAQGLTGEEAEEYLQRIASRISPATLGTSSHGHWGLDRPHYAWFTSPLRRYPDIINLRALLDDFTDPYLDEKSTNLTELFRAQVRDQKEHMKAAAYRRTLHMINKNGVESVDNVSLRVAIKSLIHAGKASDKKMDQLIQHRLATGNYALTHLIDIIVEHDDITNNDTLKAVMTALIEPTRLAQVIHNLVSRGTFAEIMLQHNGSIGASSMLQRMAQERGRPVPLALESNAAREKITATTDNQDAIRAAVQGLYNEDYPLNSKSKLLEHASKKKARTSFKLISQSGPAHEPIFEVEVAWHQKLLQIVKRSKASAITLAERHACHDILQEIAKAEGCKNIGDEINIENLNQHPKCTILEHAVINKGKLVTKKSNISGEEHNPMFEILLQYTCKKGIYIATGNAGSKRQAERDACQRILEQLNVQGGSTN